MGKNVKIAAYVLWFYAMGIIGIYGVSSMVCQPLVKAAMTGTFGLGELFLVLMQVLVVSGCIMGMVVTIWIAGPVSVLRAGKTPQALSSTGETEGNSHD